jgi:hypothetical protein
MAVPAFVAVSFGEAIDQIAEILPAPEAKEITAAFSGTGRLEGDAAQRIETISELSQLPPPYIVSQAWLKLQQALRDSLEFLLPDPRRNLSPDTYLSLAMNQGLLTKEEEPAVRRLRQMRNRAVHEHGAPISITDALRYQDIADAVIEKIKERRAANKRKDE